MLGEIGGCLGNSASGNYGHSVNWEISRSNGHLVTSSRPPPYRAATPTVGYFWTAQNAPGWKRREKVHLKKNRSEISLRKQKSQAGEVSPDGVAKVPVRKASPAGRGNRAKSDAGFPPPAHGPVARRPWARARSRPQFSSHRDLPPSFSAREQPLACGPSRAKESTSSFPAKSRNKSRFRASGFHRPRQWPAPRRFRPRHESAPPQALATCKSLSGCRQWPRLDPAPPRRCPDTRQAYRQSK